MPQTAAPHVAFIFDCDGTLVNSTPVWAYAQPELLHRHGVDVTVDDFAQFEHLSLEDECQAYHDTWGIGANGEKLYRELGEILIDGYSKVPPREGLLAFLKQAQEAGIAMCVATSTPAELVKSALAGAGLDAYMEFVTTTGEAGRSKQFPDVYELALRRLEERHGHAFDIAWVFEDAVFGGPRKAPMKVRKQRAVGEMGCERGVLHAFPLPCVSAVPSLSPNRLCLHKLD